MDLLPVCNFGLHVFGFRQSCFGEGFLGKLEERMHREQVIEHRIHDLAWYLHLGSTLGGLNLECVVKG